MFNFVCCRRARSSQKIQVVYSHNLSALSVARTTRSESTRSTSYANADILQTVPIADLPLELISEIFVRCLPKNPRRVRCLNEAPISLSQVSRAWREVALSTPALWTTLVSSMDQWYCDSDICYLDDCRGHGLWRGMPVETWRLWIQRAKVHPLSAYLRCTRQDIDNFTLPGYFELMLEQGRRWEELHLDFTSLRFNGVRVVVLDPAAFEQLQVLCTKNLFLTLHPDGPYTNIATLQKLGLLTARVFVHHSNLRHIDIYLDYPWVGMPDRGVYDMGSSLAMIHGASAHLSFLSLALSERFDVVASGPSNRIASVTMPNLRTLILRKNVAAARAVLNHITAPALEDLFLEFCDDPFPSEHMTHQDRDCIIGFLSRSRPPLTFLKLCVEGFNSEDVRRILFLTPQLQNLLVDTKGNETIWTEFFINSFVKVMKREEICPLLVDLKLHHRPVTVDEHTHAAVVHDIKVTNIMSLEASFRESQRLMPINKYRFITPRY